MANENFEQLDFLVILQPTTKNDRIKMNKKYDINNVTNLPLPYPQF